MKRERVKVPCDHPDILKHYIPTGLPYCPVISRGYNISCDFCLSRKLWKKFIEQDNERR